ncbi:MAG: oligosaccharide flippase family protein [Fibrobacterales bacterium]
MGRLTKQVIPPLVADSFWAVLGNGLGKGAVVIALMVAAKMLDTQLFGELGVLRNTALMVAVLASLGLGYTANSFVAQFMKQQQRENAYHITRWVLGIGLALAIITGLGVYSAAKPIATNLLNAPHLTSHFGWVGLLIAFLTMVTIQTGVVSGLGLFRPLSKVLTIQGALSLGTIIGGTYWWGLQGTLWGLIAAQFILALLQQILIQRAFVGCTPQAEKGVVQKLKQFTVPVALQESLYALLSWCVTLLMVHLSTFSEVGLYNAAFQWIALILFIPTMLRNVSLSHLSATITARDRNRIIKQALIINAVAIGIPTLALLGIAPYIESFYGGNFQGLATVLQILLLMVIPAGFNNLFTQVYMSVHKNWIALGIRVVRDAFVLVLFYGGVEMFLLTGSRALAWSLPIAYIGGLVLFAGWYMVFLKDSDTLSAVEGSAV